MASKMYLKLQQWQYYSRLFTLIYNHIGLIYNHIDFDEVLVFDTIYVSFWDLGLGCSFNKSLAYLHYRAKYNYHDSTLKKRSNNCNYTAPAITYVRRTSGLKHHNLGSFKSRGRYKHLLLFFFFETQFQGDPWTCTFYPRQKESCVKSSHPCEKAVEG